MKQIVSHAFIHYFCIASLVPTAWASIGLAVGIAASSTGGKDQPVIRVEVYNYAHIGRLELRQAERQAADLFASAGDRIVWLEFPDQKPLVQSSPDD
jgi:hypothetical protein